MYLSRKMFMLAAEEMNFTKAARRAHVTQQCLSAHIKKLEEHYQILLFERKPKLQLTLAGKSFYQSLCELRIMETSIKEKIDDIKKEIDGEVSFGINATRAQILMPKVISEYQEKIPNVKVSLVLDDMCNLVPLILNGTLDMFLGIDCISDPLLRTIPLACDEVFLIAKIDVLKKYANNKHVLIESLKKSTIDLSNFRNIPVAANNIGSSFTNLINRYFDAENIHRNTIFSVSDYELQIKVCSQNDIISFCPTSALKIVFKENSFNPPEQELKVFKLHNMRNYLRLDLVMHREMYLSYFKSEFIELFKKSMELNLLSIQKELANYYENNKKQLLGIISNNI